MQSNNRKDKSQTQNQNNNRVNSETGALISVELQHSTGRATGASSTGRGWSRVTQRFFVVGSSAATESSTRTTGGSRWWRTVDGRARCGGASSDLAVWAGFGAGCKRRWSTGGCLYAVDQSAMYLFNCVLESDCSSDSLDNSHWGFGRHNERNQNRRLLTIVIAKLLFFLFIIWIDCKWVTRRELKLKLMMVTQVNRDCVECRGIWGWQKATGHAPGDANCYRLDWP